MLMTIYIALGVIGIISILLFFKLKSRIVFFILPTHPKDSITFFLEEKKKS